MPYQIIPHTADVRLSVSGGSFSELVGEAVAGLMKLLGGRGQGEKVERRVRLRSLGRTELLVDFLGEVLALSAINREVYDRMEVVKLEETEIEARLAGHRIDSFATEVKGVTYHEAEVKEENGQWQVSLVLDV